MIVSPIPAPGGNSMTPEQERGFRHQAAIVARDALLVGADHTARARGALVKALSCVGDDLTTARHIAESILSLIESEASSRNRAAEMASLADETGKDL